MEDLYKIDIKEQSSEHLAARVLLQPQHPIFTGHFPGQPILPGVCMVQLVCDAIQCALGKVYILTAASNIKFTAPVNPSENPFIDLTVQWRRAEDSDLLKIDAQAFHKKSICLKLKALFALVD